MIENVQKIIEAELEESNASRGLFQDENVLSFDYLPECLPHRGDQIREMTRYFRALFVPSQQAPNFRQSLILVGGTGSGKSSTARRFGHDSEKLVANKNPHFQFLYRHLNCRKTRTVYLLLIELLQAVSPNFPQRGFSAGELLRELVQALARSNSYILLVLDEIDYLFRDPEINSLLYSLTRIQDDGLAPLEQRISLVIITRNQDFIHLLDPSTRSSLAKNIVKFNPYSVKQLEDILWDRAHLGALPEVVSFEVINSIASFAHDHTSDARLAIETLWRAIRIAESVHSQTVKPEHVRIAQSNVSSVNIELLRDLPIQHKVVLLSISKLFQQDQERSTITLTMVKRQFQEECRQFGLKVGQGHTSLWSYIQKLSDLGLVKTRVANRGTKGRVTEIQLDIPAAKLTREIELMLPHDYSMEDRSSDLLKRLL